MDLIGEELPTPRAIAIEIVYAEGHLVTEGSDHLIDQIEAAIQKERDRKIRFTKKAAKALTSQVLDSLKELKELPLNGLHCSICLGSQHDTPGGPCCDQGHGGVEGIVITTKDLLTSTKISSSEE